MWAKLAIVRALVLARRRQQMVTRYTLEHDEASIQTQLVRMSHMVDGAIERAVGCLKDRSRELARDIIQSDQAINELQRHIEDECLATLARQQPVAGDLRCIVADMHIADELERIGDHAADIGKIVSAMPQETLPIVLDGVMRMAEQCRAMLGQVMQAYVTHDPQLARTAATEDQALDLLNAQIVDELLSSMCGDCDKIKGGTHLLWVIHNLERIGDRATNIAERVIFMISGQNPELNR
jgi:phosphate transport system protein